MHVNSVLVTGANRGLGLEFIRQFLSSPTPPDILVATYRDPNTSKDLLELAKNRPSLHAVQLDVTDSKAFPPLISRLEHLVGHLNLFQELIMRRDDVSGDKICHPWVLVIECRFKLLGLIAKVWMCFCKLASNETSNGLNALLLAIKNWSDNEEFILWFKR